ncbi:LLM class flavin-dependent oxidoreductase [Pseudomaricurvus alcaniphilus]|uniref:LLM class flavin-dependent oxidoreductase n=1 Tax=Pseudomaricurvus alcaniphilus TaxID=1166482 RepID=UPI00140B6AB4|nr:LLM class flavin-dependent oxidoreductase [Pseudomaricurvus alcaniphilus]NHN38653.1 LLM class flavin-dependent oxidoreductase [Pseudomaricurvus alcaniphilus]
MINYSLLDLCPVVEGSNPAETFQRSLDLAQHAERWGYNRYWLAEHHNMPGIASAATAVVIGHIAAGTSRIRVGAGGIMLPNHSPLIIAEQFGTLEALFPGRIDLGLGRAPGTDQATARALRRDLQSNAERFPQDVMDLQALLGDPQPGQGLLATPGSGSKVPLWILGSSTFGAQLAAALGLPYAFASHFAPGDLQVALKTYRHYFQPSQYLDKPYVTLGFNVIAADSDEEAELLSSSMQKSFVSLRQGKPLRLQPPQANYLPTLGPAERHTLQQVLSCSAIGSAATVETGIRAFLEQTGADELMLNGNIFDHRARLRSFEIAADVMQKINGR